MFFDVVILDEMNFCSLHEINLEISCFCKHMCPEGIIEETIKSKLEISCFGKQGQHQQSSNWWKSSNNKLQ
jgi:hypothetical protein